MSGPRDKRNIRDRRLYRGGWRTFESFCQAELEMGKSNVNRLLKCAEVAELLATNVAKPEREAHIRPLLRLNDPVEREHAYRKAVDQAKHEGKPLTAALAD